MRYLSGGLFHQKKFFPVKSIGIILLFPWLLVFYYLIDAFVIYNTSTSSMLLFLNISFITSSSSHFHCILTVLSLSSFKETVRTVNVHSKKNMVPIRMDKITSAATAKIQKTRTCELS